MTTTLSCSRDDTTVRIRVVDQGIGIDAELLPRMFDPFTGSGAHGTDGEHSTGLGLAITRSLVAARGGTISVSREPGRGSRFEVDLPIRPIHD